jgi:hypothetical protein
MSPPILVVPLAWLLDVGPEKRIKENPKGMASYQKFPARSKS